MELAFQYRGPLESCNFACEYCPFAKTVDDAPALARDRVALERFLAFIRARPSTDRLSVLFTPWGEALTRRWYREAMVELSHLPQIEKVAVQTNLSGGLSWLGEAAAPHVGLWATFHPDFADRTRFLENVSRARALGVSISVGMVAFRRMRAEIESLRAALPGDVYFWLNAPKSSERLDAAEIAALERVDPLFRFNTVHHASRGASCGAGSRIVSVSGDGTVRRCHFVGAPLGNLYAMPLKELLTTAPCPNDTCGCHLGYVHLDRLGLADAFGDGILERNPRLPILADELDRVIGARESMG